MLLDEIIQEKEEEVEEEASKSENQDMKEEEDEESVRELDTFIKTWEKEFDRANPDPEENSDFDSDNDINPLDTLSNSGKYVSSQGGKA